jgi:flagellar motor switch protein FliM
MEANLRQTNANVSVQLGIGSTTPREFLKFNKGDILQLSTSPADESMILIEGEPKFYGNVGSFRGNRAIKVSRPIPNRDLINYRNRLGAIIHGG